MNLIINRVFELIGQTPILQIHSYPLINGVKIFAKLEQMNPGGSVKDRLGIELIEDAVRKGKLQKGYTVIEPTAGNTGIGLAIAAKKYELQLIVVVPKKFSIEKQQIMTALGAKVVSTATEKGMSGAIEKSKELLLHIPKSYSLNQFMNKANPLGYFHTLGPELWRDLQGEIDIFIAGAGTSGTFVGVAKYLKMKNSNIKTIIVEPENSILQGVPGSHETEGIGMEFLPPFLDYSLIDDVYSISDIDAFHRTRELARNESLLVGSSSGAVMHACLEEAKKATEPINIVTIFPDSGERYLSKNIYGG